jgi:hypothetical protein
MWPGTQSADRRFGRCDPRPRRASRLLLETLPTRCQECTRSSEAPCCQPTETRAAATPRPVRRPRRWTRGAEHTADRVEPAYAKTIRPRRACSSTGAQVRRDDSPPTGLRRGQVGRTEPSPPRRVHRRQDLSQIRHRRTLEIATATAGMGSAGDTVDVPRAAGLRHINAIEARVPESLVHFALTDSRK